MPKPPAKGGPHREGKRVNIKAKKEKRDIPKKRGKTNPV